jgi:hypothetical protein
VCTVNCAYISNAALIIGKSVGRWARRPQPLGNMSAVWNVPA